MLAVTKHYVPNYVEETEDSGRQIQSDTWNCTTGCPASRLPLQVFHMC